MIRCSRCGYEAREATPFCPGCGQAMAVAPQQPAPVAASATGPQRTLPARAAPVPAPPAAARSAGRAVGLGALALCIVAVVAWGLYSSLGRPVPSATAVAAPTMSAGPATPPTPAPTADWRTALPETDRSYLVALDATVDSAATLVRRMGNLVLQEQVANSALADPAWVAQMTSDGQDAWTLGLDMMRTTHPHAPVAMLGLNQPLVVVGDGLNGAGATARTFPQLIPAGRANALSTIIAALRRADDGLMQYAAVEQTIPGHYR